MTLLNLVMQSIYMKYHLNLHAQGFDQIVLDHFGINAPQADMTDWKELVDKVKNLRA